MDGSKDVDTALVNNLVVSDLDENGAILLPEVLSRPASPVGRDEIPQQEDVVRWSHLQGHVYLTDLNSGVDLLIGADVSEALQPREIIPAADGGPYATRFDLGWVINGPTGRKQKYYLALTSSLRLRRLILYVQLVLISWMHLTPIV